MLIDAASARHVRHAIEKLPIPKLMRWGDGDAQFVRPVHGLVIMHGNRVLPSDVLGLKGGNKYARTPIPELPKLHIVQAQDYLQALQQKGT